MPSIWLTDYNSFGETWKVDETGSVIKSFTVGPSGPQGIALDRDGCIFMADYGDPSLYKFDQDGNSVSQFTAPSGTPMGLSVEDNGCVWLTEISPANSTVIYELDASTNVQRSWSVGFPSAIGITAQDNGQLWVQYRSTELNKKHEQRGTLSGPSFSDTDFNGHQGIDADESIWITDEGSSSVKEYDKSGSVSKSFAGPAAGHTGVTTSDEPVDNPACLWICEGGQFYRELRQDGTETGRSFSYDGPGSPTEDMAHDVDGCIWHQHISLFGARSIVELAKDGSITTQESGSFVSGFREVGADTDGCLWTEVQSAMRKVAQSDIGEALQSFVSPDDAQGIVTDLDNSITFTNTNSTTVVSYYTLNRSGSQTCVISVPLSGSDSLNGLAIDDNESLWTTDTSSGGSSIVKFDQTGTQVSLISIPSTASFLSGMATDDQPVSVAFTSATDTAVKTSFAFTGIEGEAVGEGTVQAVKAAFSYTSEKGQPAKVWFDTTKQWDNAQQQSVAHASDVVSLSSGEGRGYIIPSQQNWEG